MTVKIYESGSFRMLAGAKVYHNGAWVTLPATAKVYLNNGWHYLGNVSSGVVVNNNVTVSSGWIYIDTTINSGGLLHVNSGGTANNITVNTWGRVDVASGGSALGVAWTPGVGRINVFGGAHVTYTSNYSGIYVGDGSQLLSHPATMTGETVDSRLMYVMSGGTASSIIFTGTGGSMYVSNSGVVQNTTLSNWGSMHVCNGGIATDTKVGFHGYMCVNSGGTANSITLSSGGDLYISSGGKASNITIKDGLLNFPVAPNTYVQGTSAGSAFIMQDAHLSGYTINSAYRIHVSSGGTATSSTVNYGNLYISSGGTANNTTINTSGGVLKGIMFIENGGKANNTTVNSGGALYVSSGGTALNVTSMAGAQINVSAGGTITYA